MAGMKEELKKAWQFLRSIEFWRMAVLWNLSILYSYLLLFSRSFLYFSINHRSETNYSDKSVSPCTSEAITPLCIITGATSGLGAAAALALSKRGFYVVLAGRSGHLLLKTMSEIKRQNEDALLKAFQVDLLSIQSILNFKNSLQLWLQDSKMHPSVQLLINNAGILATSSRITSEGYDQMMATNYVGPFFLTQMLLPLLKNSPSPSRIVNVSSFTHRCVLDIQVDEDTVCGKCFKGLDQYPCASIYEYSKLCILLFSYELHRKLFLGNESPNKVSIIVADPGVVKTNITREVPLYVSWVAFTVLRLLRLLQLPEDGVSSILDAALASPETSGVYFFGGKGRTVKSSARSYNTKVAEELWATSFNLFLKSQLATEGGSSA
ncbi:dehydrogenase/reductase SDR family member on chromosome X-like [Momordica charantia]|uniref:Dehydrogenase/reductase SDR family member on chromosome X-like n=1 Tax=Momordica charantia TaxID=3673 RepID=A0A6J1CZD5_MOMCH|nr:dehydrogenase/reductase SDR family member on chromosome X-like [Momordica charantia]XP_022146357.1 dehydrogenase/reductase SDR family member on chromosome X-like [Momordica charantia]